MWAKTAFPIEMGKKSRLEGGAPSGRKSLEEESVDLHSNIKSFKVKARSNESNAKKQKAEMNQNVSAAKHLECLCDKDKENL